MPLHAVIARSTAYRLLSQGFRYPSPNFLRDLHDGTYPQALAAALFLAHPEEKALEALPKPAKKSLRTMEEDYVRFFDAGFPEPPCPPYEGYFREKETRTAILLEVSEFYRHFGLRMNGEEGQRELADHLAAELEFMHFLTHREACARQEGRDDFDAGFRLAQKDFLERHLAQWVPEFAAKVQSLRVPVYMRLAAVLQDFVSREMHHLGGTKPRAGTVADTESRAASEQSMPAV